ncbi:metal-dependent hydrolase [Stigmatella sp. ncwal1]|uniref:Metal-dependent hydrolase n=1 Tax=Stigmatella ashevillensis TaxID=2995309 RepID=A0ABT5DEP6_9BACT|nr:metal-dependent hydrolase [Stigmatella ashevillena]MDC0710806.1 metal-dependent hydrolase [Stigmatella ashevillena]
MDNLTHGLMGLALGALRRPDAADSPLSATDKAVLLGCVLAAELPDLDNLLPSENSVVHALQAHRGLSHALVFTPVIAGAATLVAKGLFRSARMGPVYLFSLLSVAFAHLLADLWTGWGTRVLLPFSAQRWTLDWTMVVDPWVTLPLLAGALWAWLRREQWRRALLWGLVGTVAYLGVRVSLQTVLSHRVRGAWPAAERVQVFPAWLSLTTWRYVVVLPSEYVTGTVALGSAPHEQRRWPRPGPEAVPASARNLPTVREALAWARFPLVSTAPQPEGGTELRIGDLRYHLGGEPTLQFILELSPQGELRAARLDRGGSAASLLRRWRTPEPAPGAPTPEG